jgi:hypothetical protein
LGSIMPLSSIEMSNSASRMPAIPSNGVRIFAQASCCSLEIASFFRSDKYTPQA